MRVPFYLDGKGHMLEMDYAQHNLRVSSGGRTLLFNPGYFIRILRSDNPRWEALNAWFDCVQELPDESVTAPDPGIEAAQDGVVDNPETGAL